MISAIDARKKTYEKRTSSNAVYAVIEKAVLAATDKGLLSVFLRAEKDLGVEKAELPIIMQVLIAYGYDLIRSTDMETGDHVLEIRW